MSRPSITTYHRPESLEEAWDHVAPGDPSLRVLSGGADLTIHAPPEVQTLVDVGRVLDKGIDLEDDGTIRIGAMATLTDVMEHPVLASHGTGVIPEMMIHVGNPLLRNFSTIGGHMARGKLSDVLPVFLALDCEVHFYNGTDNTQALSDYYEQGSHRNPHILTALSLPPLPEKSAAAFLRFAKTTFDFPLLNVSCRVDDGGEIRIVFGATPRRSQRATMAESVIAEHGLTEASINQAAMAARGEVRTGGGWVASPEYRTQLVEVLAKRCLGLVAQRLEAR